MATIDHNVYKALIRFTYDWLANIGTSERLNAELGYYWPNSLRIQYHTLDSLLIRLADTLRNRQGMGWFSDQLMENTRQFINGYGIKAITSMEEATYNQNMTSVLGRKPDDYKGAHTYSRGLNDAAFWLAKFDNPESFYDHVDKRSTDPDSMWALIKELDDQVMGIGPALACDFLKEVGVKQCGKPDLHVKRILSELGIISQKKDDRETFNALNEIASATGVAPVILDKLLWMACSRRWDRTWSIIGDPPKPHPPCSEYIKSVKKELGL